MALAVIATVLVLLALYFGVPLLLERLKLIKLQEPQGGWPDRKPRERTDTEAGSGEAPRGGGGRFGGGGASGDW